ncbi:hypothetical protein HY992_00280 [Candidatus Micrarchaeota archaeon]|nr:hypothetical protein [Candidatus Micrarchaeota archaeon]
MFAIEKKEKSKYGLYKNEGGVYWFQNGVYKGKLFGLSPLFGDVEKAGVFVSPSGTIFLAHVTSGDSTKFIVSAIHGGKPHARPQEKFEAMRDRFDHPPLKKASEELEAIHSLCLYDHMQGIKESESERCKKIAEKAGQVIIEGHAAERRIIRGVSINDDLRAPEFRFFEGRVLLHARNNESVPWGHVYIFDSDTGEFRGGKGDAEYVKKAGFSLE